MEVTLRRTSPCRTGNHLTTEGNIPSPKGGNRKSCNGIPHTTNLNEVTSTNALLGRKDFDSKKGIGIMVNGVDLMTLQHKKKGDKGRSTPSSKKKGNKNKNDELIVTPSSGSILKYFGKKNNQAKQEEEESTGKKTKKQKKIT